MLEIDCGILSEFIGSEAYTGNIEIDNKVNDNVIVVNSFFDLHRYSLPLLLL